MSWAVESIIPENFEVWRVETNTFNGRTCCTARRYGVTFTIVFSEGWWTVTKIHGGKAVATYVTKELPSRVQLAVERGRRRRRHVA
jgi:hypothetical protein